VRFSNSESQAPAQLHSRADLFRRCYTPPLLSHDLSRAEASTPNSVFEFALAAHQYQADAPSVTPLDFHAVIVPVPETPRQFVTKDSSVVYAPNADAHPLIQIERSLPFLSVCETAASRRGNFPDDRCLHARF